MVPVGILRERAKFSGVDLDWRTTKEPTGLSDKISIVMSLKKKRLVRWSFRKIFSILYICVRFS